MYYSKCCEVSYDKVNNVVFVKWKQFCCGEAYRMPLEEAIRIMSENDDCHYVADTRDGFEDEAEDTKWVTDVFSKRAYQVGCRYIFFIIDANNTLKEELEGQTTELSKLFTVKAFYSMDEIAEYLKSERAKNATKQ